MCVLFLYLCFRILFYCFLYISVSSSDTYKTWFLFHIVIAYHIRQSRAIGKKFSRILLDGIEGIQYVKKNKKKNKKKNNAKLEAITNWLL